MPRRALFPLAACAAVVIFGGALALADRLEDTFYVSPDHPAIQYHQEPDDPVARLEKRLEGGQVKLGYAPNGLGYLPALLKQLDINVDSQVLVFSKTSIQTSHISPQTPRAIYFNDTVAVGYVQGGDVLEVSALDPKLGIILYSMDVDPASKAELSRRDDCLRCHQGPVTLGVPGILVSSVHPKSNEPGEGHGSAYMTDQSTPLKERWGGWYVTGTTGDQAHLGNNVALVDPLHPGGGGSAATQNLTDLKGLFDTSRYLAPTSDIVALLTLEHQTRMTNLLTRIGWDTRIMLADHKGDAEAEKKLASEIDEMVNYMLFTDEEPLKGPVAGVSSFTKTFAARGPKDAQGRSLRDFDLKTRLFRYPLSYMIYSANFDALPDYARERVYRRLYDVLSGKDQRETYAKLSADDRRSILEIVRGTKSKLPAYWN